MRVALQVAKARIVHDKVCKMIEDAQKVVQTKGTEELGYDLNAARTEIKEMAKIRRTRSSAMYMYSGQDRRYQPSLPSIFAVTTALHCVQALPSPISIHAPIAQETLEEASDDGASDGAWSRGGESCVGIAFTHCQGEGPSEV